ncbi:Serine/threonine-protein kinase 17A, partial [Camponotus floridanus]
LQPQNLVMMGSFPDCDVKLCDFEISRVILEGTEVREILGTPDYVAPEILHYEPITLAADMWSLGVTTYVLLTGFSPFGGETDQETFRNISLGEVDFPEELFEDISAQAKDFVAKLLVLDPSARMTAKQCLRHDWLRGAPMQASPHLRRYLSKSREVLLERVVSRENLRRAALISQTTSQASLCQADLQNDQNSHQQHHQQGQLQDCLLSQSEMCLTHHLTESRLSLAGSEEFPSPVDSQVSLESSRTNLSYASQSCLLNQEQTKGLLSKAQSRSQANLNQGLSRGILSRIRSLNRVQSQACLLNGSAAIGYEEIAAMNLVISKSREKLYGLRSLSKSQGVLDIYKSLECLKRRRKSYQRAKTEDMLSILKQFSAEIASSRLVPSMSDDRIVTNVTSKTDLISDKIEKINQDIPTIVSTNPKIPSGFNDDNRDNLYMSSNNTKREAKNIDELQIPKKLTSESEENLDSLKSVESDTLTEDSDEMPLRREAKHDSLVNKHHCERQYSNVSSHSNNSAMSDDKEDRSTESENDEPKYTVAQLVSAFNKHQEVASRTSLKAIMSERRINEVIFPTGTKALRLFIPDINITENKIVRRKTSYKPRKNWEELRKRNEKNEGVLKNRDNEGVDNKTWNELSERKENQEDSVKVLEENVATISELISQNEDTNLPLDHCSLLQSEEGNEQSFIDTINTGSNLDITIDEKYKQCVKGAMSGKIETSAKNQKRNLKPLETQHKITISIRQKERLPNYIYPDVTLKDDNHEVPKKTSVIATNGKSGSRIGSKIERNKSNCGTTNVNLKDILQRVDSFKNTPKENLENLRKRTSIAKIILNDNLVHDNQDGYETSSCAKNEPSLTDRQPEERTKLTVPPSFIRSSSLSSDSSCPTPSSMQSDINVSSWEDVQVAAGSSTSLEKEDVCRVAKKSDIQGTFSEGRNRQYTEERKGVWGRICTGSYIRAMEKFSGKNVDAARKSTGSTILAEQTEKTRRKSSSAMPRII